MSLKERAIKGAFVVATLSMMAAGCGGEPEFAPQPGPPDGGADAAPPPPPPATVATTPPPAQPGPCASEQSIAMTTMFKGRAGSEAPGMKEEGSAICGVV